MKNGFNYESKALDYYLKLLEENNYDPNKIEELLKDGNVGSSILSDTWWEDSNFNFSNMFLSHFTTKEVLDMFDFYKPPSNLTEQEIQEQCCDGDFYTYGNYAPKCQNTKCENHRDNDNNWCSYSDWADACIVDTVYNILLAFEIGGWSAIDELRPQFNKKIINRISETLPTNYIGKKEQKLYGDDNMVKQFWTALSELKTEDDISVYWDDGIMYVNDESDGQATENVSLFQAYKFAVLINASIFDYTASDEEVKHLSEQLLDLIDEDERAVNIWKYFDDISEDFKKLTGININIDEKRAIVSYMTEMGEDGYNLMCGFGSVSFIAKMLWKYIKGDKDDFCQPYHNHNKIANKLADKYLQTDDYDIIKFAEELHKEMKFTHEITINGALWVNSAKYEYVDKIIVDAEEVNIYLNNKLIGCILRENINTIEEQYVETGSITNLEDVLEFNIKKVGDF